MSDRHPPHQLDLYLTSPDIFEAHEDPPAVVGARLRDAAIDRAGDAAPDRWWRAAELAIGGCAVDHPDGFTTDEVWTKLDRLDVGAPPEPRAMGAAMRRAQAAGVCTPTDRVRPTIRPQAHRRPVRVWIPS